MEHVGNSSPPGSCASTGREKIRSEAGFFPEKEALDALFKERGANRDGGKASKRSPRASCLRAWRGCPQPF